MVKYIWKDLRQRIFDETGYIVSDGDFSLSANTTIGTGGRAAAFFPERKEQLKDLIRALKSLNITFRILGRGSNVLSTDGDYGGVIISTKRLKGAAYSGDTVSAMAGEDFSSLIAAGEKKGVLLCPFMAGIPSTVGGAVYMNAGVSEGHIDSAVKSVTYTDGFGFYIFSEENCRFSYKDSVFMRLDGAIVSAEFYAEKSDDVKKEIDYFLSKRRGLPSGRSMGCVFKNPKGLYAGRIIEECGLKGEREGGAVISEKHANFIINDRSATADDVKKLINRVKEIVYRKTGIILEEEIQYLD